MTTKTAAQHAAELNAPNREWLALNPGGWCTMLPEEPEHWAAQGIHTAEELDRMLATGSYSDTYKETHGVRPRKSWDGVPTAEIWAAVKALNDRLFTDLDDFEF